MCAAFEPCKVGTNNSLITHPHYPRHSDSFVFNTFEVGTTVAQYIHTCLALGVKLLASNSYVTRRAGVDRARSSGRSGSEFGRTWLQRAGRCADSAFVSGLQSR